MLKMNVVREVQELPRDRSGLVVGRHVLGYFVEESRAGKVVRNFRVSVEASEHAAHCIFVVDKIAEDGISSVLRQVSYPSASDLEAL